MCLKDEYMSYNTYQGNLIIFKFPCTYVISTHEKKSNTVSHVDKVN